MTYIHICPYKSERRKIETLAERQKEVIACFRDVDFSLLPIHLTEVWKRVQHGDPSAVYELIRFIDVIPFYSEFSSTFVQRTPRTMLVRDQFDLCAYMLRNSSLQLNPDGTPTVPALEHLDMLCKDSSHLLEQYLTEVNNLLYQNSVICQYIWAICQEQLNAISQFRTLFARQLYVEKPFLSVDHSYESIRPIDLFQQLPVEHQLEIATGQWRKVDVRNRNVLYLIVLKFLFDCSLERSQCNRHPYLLARWGNPLDIAQAIVKEADGIDSRLRVLATNYSLVADIPVAQLTIKCLELKIQ